MPSGTKIQMLRTGVSMLCISLALTACASSASQSISGTEIRIRYAEVIGIERTRLPSSAPAGAVVGGFTGLVLTSNRSPRRQLAGGIAGAALGGLATAALEGERMGYSYKLRFAGGDHSSFITEKGYLQQGDCVSVERGQYANVRRVPSLMCEGSTETVATAHVDDAAQCHSAKEQLLVATDSMDVETAARKVSILCDY